MTDIHASRAAVSDKFLGGLISSSMDHKSLATDMRGSEVAALTVIILRADNGTILIQGGSLSAGAPLGGKADAVYLRGISDSAQDILHVRKNGGATIATETAVKMDQTGETPAIIVAMNGLLGTK